MLPGQNKVNNKFIWSTSQLYVQKPLKKNQDDDSDSMVIKFNKTSDKSNLVSEKKYSDKKKKQIPMNVKI